MRKHHSALGGVALALALTLTGCSDDGTDPEAEDTPTATPVDDRTPARYADAEDARGERCGCADELLHDHREGREERQAEGPGEALKRSPRVMRTSTSAPRSWTTTPTGSGSAGQSSTSSATLVTVDRRNLRDLRTAKTARSPRSSSSPRATKCRSRTPTATRCRQGEGRLHRREASKGEWVVEEADVRWREHASAGADGTVRRWPRG